MKFFEAVPGELFSPLASPNRALYADALDVLYTAYRENLKIREDTLYSMLRSRLEQQLADATFEGEDIDEDELRDISGRARFLIRKLCGKGWFEKERGDDFEEYITVPSYSSRLLELFHQLRDDRPARGFSYVFGTYSALKVANESESVYDKKTCELLRTKGISAQFSLVGSGARNMITRNGDGPYDLDYNLLIMKAEERYWNDLRLLKETVRNALNRAERREFFSDAQDSTSCLTALLHFKDTPNVEFSFDVAITTKNKNGNYMRLIHNKNVYALGLDQYTWNEVPNSHQVKDRADKLKRAGLWQKVRDRYLEKKNMYLFRQDHNHPSFVVYVEAVNEVYNRYFNRGGGYSVQSIF